MNKKQKQRLLSLWKRYYDAPVTPLPDIAECKKQCKYIFDSLAPEDGDFCLRGEGGDWKPYRCCDGEDGCSGWDMTCRDIEISRKDGKNLITVRSCDRYGNWDLDFCSEDPTDGNFICYLREEHPNEYFRAWAEYWLECAESNSDPLEQAMSSWEDIVKGRMKDKWSEFCLNAAEKYIQYVER